MTPLYRWRLALGWDIRQAAFHLSITVREYQEAEANWKVTLRNCPIDTLPIYPF